jgi:glucosylglycerate hydrolase
VSAAEIARALRVPSGEQAAITAWISLGRRGHGDSWNTNLGLCLHLDLRAGAPLRVRTVAGFSPCVAGGLGHELLETLHPKAFLGYPKLRWPLPLSNSRSKGAFAPAAAGAAPAGRSSPGSCGGR